MNTSIHDQRIEYPSSQALPRRLGFRMPAEWEPHRATWIAWPHNVSDWPGKFHPIPWVFAEIVRWISRYEDVVIIVSDAATENRVRRLLDKAHAVEREVRFYLGPTNRCWTRDFLPTFVVDRDGKRLGAVKWAFNGWAKYEDWSADEATGTAVAREVANMHWFPHDRATQRRIVLEGGAIDVDGTGNLLTTEECLLSEIQQRNPGFSRADYERLFHDCLGVTNTIWLAGGISGDDTHGHIDDTARFVAPDTIVAAVEMDRSAPHYQTLRENVRRLETARSVSGAAFTVIELPLPGPVLFAGQRLPASYANFYVGNEFVLVPTFNDPHDRIALTIFEQLFPGRTVVGIYCRDMVLGLGTLHCATQQEPFV